MLTFPILPAHCLDDFLSAWVREEGFRILAAKWYLWLVLPYADLVLGFMAYNLQPVQCSPLAIVTVPTAIVCGLRHLH